MTENDEAINQVQKLINNLDFDSVKADNKIILKKLTELLKQHEVTRKYLDDQFYTKVQSKLCTMNSKKLDENNNDDDENLLIMRCLRNSAACENKTDFMQRDQQLCEFLILLIRNHLNDQKTIDSETPMVLVTILQYFTNLVQGNQSAFELYRHEWLKLGLSLLNAGNSEQAIIYGSTLVFFILQKSERNRLSLTKHIYLALLSKALSDKSNAEPVNWLLKLCQQQFNCFYFHGLSRTLVHEYPTRARIRLFQMFNNSLDTFETQLDFQVLTDVYEIVSSDVLSYLNGNGHILANLDDRLHEVKLLLECLNDLLSANDHAQYLNIPQSNRSVMENTCSILNLLHKSIDINQHYAKINENSKKIGFMNIKCELIRFIGLLAYTNELNAFIIKQTNTMDSIIENIRLIDIDQPLIREWAIVTLKHLHTLKSN